jgi:glycosyltransferase involved in cell wall biosynthesis
MEEKKDLSIIVPLLNEEGNVKELHRRIKVACEALGKSYEIIFIDDGSTDKTVEFCQNLSPLKLIKQRKRFGQTAAFDAGIKNAVGDIVITMDGDLQNDPADIGKLLEKMNEGFDVVSGWRHERKDPFMKKISSRMANIVRQILIEDNIHDSGCSLKAYKRDCFSGVDLFGEMHRFMPAILQFDGYKVSEVKVSHHARMHGVTKYNWKRGVKGIADMISIWFWRKYSSRPLHLFGATGMALSFVGVLILIWMAIEKVFFHSSLAQRIWPLIGVFFVMVGVLLFVFGLMADIMVRTYYKNQGRMNYSIKEIIES